MSLRILALTNLYPNPWQPGRAPFNRQQFRALAESCALSVIAPIAWTDELRARWRRAAGMPAGRRVSCDGIAVDHPRYVFPPKLFRNWYGHCFRRSVRSSFNRAVNEFRPNVVYASWAYPDSWAAVDLGHLAGLPVVIKVHGSDIYLLDRHPARKRRTREALCQADGIITPSRDLAERVVELGVDPTRVHVIYNGVDTDKFHPGPQADARRRLGLPLEERIVLFIGNLVPIKGLDQLIEACARLMADKVRFTCYVIGEGPLARRLLRQVQDRGLTNCIKLMGSRPHDELPDWYRSADLFILPSQSEGVPNVLLEAAACGTPFVASDVGGIPEIAHSGRGRLAPSGDVASLTQAIRDALTHPMSTDSPLPAPVRSVAESAMELADVLRRVVESQTAQQPGLPDRAAIVPVESR